jgi:hypothetical protein
MTWLHGFTGSLYGGNEINHQLTGYSIASAGEPRTGKPHSKFILEQNYPNPFNSTTVIRFTVVERSPVTLKVFDSLGKEIADLLSKEMQPGSYEETVILNHVASGIYFYRLQQGQYVATKSMLLLK